MTWGLFIIGPPNYSFDDINTMSFTTLLSAQIAYELNLDSICKKNMKKYAIKYEKYAEVNILLVSHTMMHALPSPNFADAVRQALSTRRGRRGRCAAARGTGMPLRRPLTRPQAVAVTVAVARHGRAGRRPAAGPARAEQQLATRRPGARRVEPCPAVTTAR